MNAKRMAARRGRSAASKSNAPETRTVSKTAMSAHDLLSFDHSLPRLAETDDLDLRDVSVRVSCVAAVSAAVAASRAIAPSTPPCRGEPGSEEARTAPVDAEHVLEGTCLAGWAPRPSIATVTLGPERRPAPCGTIV